MIDRCPWQIGDRVIWPHRERDRTRRGAPYRLVRTAGTVTGVDNLASTRGVQVRLDEPVSDTIYATYAELEPSDEKPDAAAPNSLV